MKNCPTFSTAIKPFEPKSTCLDDVDVDRKFLNLQTQIRTMKTETDKKIKHFLTDSTTRKSSNVAGSGKCPVCVVSSVSDIGVSKDECETTDKIEQCDYGADTCGLGKGKHHVQKPIIREMYRYISIFKNHFCSPLKSVSLL